MTPPGFHRTDRPQSWGRINRGAVSLARPRFLDEISPLASAARLAGSTLLATGLGRSYGDSGLNFGHAAIDMTGLDRVIAFDAETGVLRGEAGLSLSEVIRRVVPAGWFLPTTPGTRFVTLGGAVANDVHGKNHHHAGAFGVSVRRLGLWRSDKGLIELSHENNSELFAATIGGLGLTGVILWVEIQLVRIGSSRLDVETIPFAHLDEFLDLALESEERFEHTVAWVDCSRRGEGFGRGVFTRANWRSDALFAVHDDRRRASIPFDLPDLTINRLSVAAFNTLYYSLQASRPRLQVQTYTQAFHPLDAIGEWNRIYGGRGFYQFQCVTPFSAGMTPIRALLAATAEAGAGSFLTVLKTFGDRPSPGLLSFPRPGITLAIDFANRGDATLALLSRMDDIVMNVGGRLYPAKDGRMPPAMFRAGYPQLEQFVRWIDPACSSNFWRRMQHG